MEEKIRALIEYVQANGRVCPLPNLWNKLWEILPERTQKPNDGWEPSLPLVLAAWRDTTAEQKRERLIHHIEYAASHGALDKVDKFLRCLPPDQWAYGDGITDWERWKN